MFSLNFYNNYGLPLNDKPFYQVLFVILSFIVLSSNNITDFFLLSVINILGIYMIFIIKEELKTTRPVDCKKDKIKYCPESYDIPSGHSFFAVLWIMIFLHKKNTYYYPIILYLLFVPLSRYLGKLHTLEAITSGIVLGFLWFFLYTLIYS